MSFRRFHQPLWVLVSLIAGACAASDDDAASGSSQAQVVAAADAGSAELADSTEALARAFRALPPESLCDAQWCWVDPAAGYLAYNVVGGTSADDIWFGTDASGILHWDGDALRIVPTGLTKVSTIAVIAANDVWIAGGGKAAHWDGRAFTAYPAPFGNLFRAGASLYIGGYGPLHEWTGSEFAQRANIVNATDWAGSGPNDLWVAAERDLLHFDGTAWTKVEGLRGYRVNDVISFGPNDVWVETLDSGSEGYRFYHYDGTSWTLSHTGGSHVSWIVGNGPTDRWFVTDRAATHYDGRNFVTKPLPGGISDVSIIAGLPYVVGWPGAVLRVSADPSVEHRVIARAEGKMSAVWASSPTDVWAAGREGAAWNYDGRTITPVETGVKVQLHDIHGTSKDDVWMVGNDGVLLRGSLAGGLRRLPSGVTKHLTSVFAVSPDEVWIGGAGVLLHATPSGITEVALPWLKNGVIQDIHGLAPDDLWAVTGSSATHFDGTAWSAPYALDSGGGVERVWALSPNDVWAIARGCGHGSCSSAHWTGSGWSSGIAAPPAALWAIPMQYNVGVGRSLLSWALGPKDVWSVTSGGAVVHAIGR